MADPYASSVVLHLPFDMPPAPLTGAVFDYSPALNSASLEGGAELSSVQSKFGGHALAVGSSGYVQCASSSNFDILSGDFTVEAWVYVMTAPTRILGAPIVARDGSSTGWMLRVDQYAGRLAWVYPGLGAGGTSGPVSLNAWHHVAACRAGTQHYIALDGVVTAISVTNRTVNAAVPLRVGRDNATGNGVAGYVDDVRITKGVARYTANFTPPDAIEYVQFTPTLALIDPDNTLSAFPMPAQTIASLGAVTGTSDLYYGGNGKIVGTTKNNPNTPVSRRVRLHERNSGHLIREGWSDAAGNYSFANLSRDYTYYVVGFDHTGQYQGVVADKLVPEAM